jgi:hypothetical protein
MITFEELNKMRQEGKLIISKTTFLNSALMRKDGTIDYKGKHYKPQWLLTYTHKQYYLLEDVPRINYRMVAQ